MDLDEGLRRFGLPSFRAGQREAIETLLSERRLLLVAPTGAGKSLIYQLPASLLPGTTLVISPLVALMHDQIEALSARGIPATYLAATLDSGEIARRLDGLAAGDYKLVYVAPERLALDRFRATLRRLECPLVAVDEAHCISQWGHDFRPDYLRIREVLEALPDARIFACTATATPVVRDAILLQLGLPAETPQIVRGFSRPNLRLRAAEVSGAADRRRRTDAQLAEALGAPGAARGAAIVYAPTRRSSEEETARLAARGWRAVHYHAGVDGAQRTEVSRAFSAGELEIVVATNAFGMGIDRPDVRAVIHLAPPGSLEAYYQEVGRAGRDGEPAFGLLLSSAQDLPRRRRLLEHSSDGSTVDPELVEHKWQLFLELLRWAEGGSCRHDAILRYFGSEEAEAARGCGHCDVCESLRTQPEDSGEADLVVRKALSGIARIHRRFGLTLAAKLLCGASDSRLQWSGLSEVSTFGALSERKEEWVVRLLRRCVTAGFVDFTSGVRPLALLTETGKEVMLGSRPHRLLLPPDRVRRHAGRPAVADGDFRAAGEDVLDEEGVRLFQALRAHRLEVARREGIAAYMVASDRCLRDIARLRPRNESELLLAHGIGPAKAEKYGDGLLAVLRSDPRTPLASSEPLVPQIPGGSMPSCSA